MMGKELQGFWRLFPALSVILVLCGFSPPQSFGEAKYLARTYVYHDRQEHGTTYCECSWVWAGKSGGIINLNSCGYKVRAQEHRASRIEWEHVVPASNFGKARQCWQEGGRKNCNRTDPVFNIMEADLHNLTPSVGEINADRSNYNFGMLPATKPRHGDCPFKVDFKNRTAEPRDEIKGMVARVYFYMHDRYDIRMSPQQAKLFMAWDKTYPASQWERVRDKRIAALMGHNNPFVSGEQAWKEGYRNSAAGLKDSIATLSNREDTAMIRGNQNSRIYHLPAGCPSYGAVSKKNRVLFASEKEADTAGFCKAKNCR